MFIEFHLAIFEASTWTNMFTLDETATWAEKILRPMIVYVVLILMIRIFGKRELAQLNPFDLVVILSISNTVQNAIIGQDNSLIGGLVGALALLVINYFLARLKYASPTIEFITEGGPKTLIKNGKQDEAAMKSELLTKEDLDIIAHENGLEDCHDIDKLVLDPNGSFLVDGKDEVKDAKFKRDVLKKIDELSKQLAELSGMMQKNAR
ncbi:MAG: YetF domain-containing protein [Pyrinomonadaceae bacterium]